MDGFTKLLAVLKEYWPEISAFIILYLRNEMIGHKNKTRLAELETKLLRNELEIKKENAGLSDRDIINKYAKPGSD